MQLSGRCLLCKLETLALVPSTTGRSLAMLPLRERRQDKGVVGSRDRDLKRWETLGYVELSIGLI